eukprot:10106290-Alexandrium_andersonii.AAC.1
MLQAVSGPAQFQVRTSETILARSANTCATRFDRFDSLLGSIGTRCMCHRASPCNFSHGLDWGRDSSDL